MPQCLFRILGQSLTCTIGHYNRIPGSVGQTLLPAMHLVISINADPAPNVHKFGEYP